MSQQSDSSDAHGTARQGADLPVVEIDADTCVGCGLCVRICPVEYLSQSMPKTRPEPVADGRCVHCGHCVAVCPTRAITHRHMDPAEFRPVVDNWDADSFQMLLHAKRSVRRFKNKSVPRDIVERLLTSAASAPTNSNTQDRAFLVLTESDFIQTFESAIVDGFRAWTKYALENGSDPDSYDIVAARAFIDKYERGNHPVFYNAPCVICAHSHAANFFGAYNCITAMDYLMLHAHVLGLGADRRLHSVIALGYPDIRFKRTVSRRPPQVCWHQSQNKQ